MTKVEEALVEIRAELSRLEPIHEGLRDYARLNLTEPSQAQVAAALERYDRRVERLTAAATSLEQLVADGYPDLEGAIVEKAIYDDLQAQRATIEAALATFAVNEATTLTIRPGAPEDNP